MKLPFDLGIKLIFRLLIPGLLLTLGLYPILATIRDRTSWSISIEYLLIFSVVLTGWLVVTLDQPIYMFLEGRRFWLPPIRRMFLWFERKRLERILQTDGKFYHLSEITTGTKRQNYYQRYLEASVQGRYFPLNSNGQPEAKFPTRLGNLIDSYESYPDSRYGIDAVFYWYRLSLKLDKDLREEIDTRQAMADSSVYGCVALFISGLFWFAYALTTKFAPPVIGHISKDWVWWITAAFFLFSFLLYRAALYSQAQYGEFFKSIFDVFEKQIEVKRAVERVAEITDRPGLLNDNRQNHLLITWRYLHNYKVRCPAAGCEARDPMSPEEFERHYEQYHPTPGRKAADVTVVLPHYRTTLSSVYKLEKRIHWLKILTLVIGVLLFAVGYYRNIVLVIAALVVSVAGLVAEIRLRKGQEPHLAWMNQLETGAELPPIYSKIGPSYWRDPRVLFPQIAIVVLAIVALILWLAGILPLR